MRVLIDSLSSAGGLTHKEVVKAAKNACARWFDLGIELDISVDTLEVLYSFGKLQQYNKHWHFH